MIHRRLDIGAHRLMDQLIQIMFQIRCQQIFNRRPHQVHDRMQIARLIFFGPLQLLESRLNGAAIRMPEDDHQAGAELFGGKFDATDLRRSDDIAGYAYDEQIAQPLIENDLHRHSGIGTAENGREGFLARRELDAAWEDGGIFQLTMHPHIIGYRSRIWIVDELIRHAKSKGQGKDAAWFATHAEVAAYAKEHAA